MVTVGMMFVHPEYGLSVVTAVRLNGECFCQQMRGIKWIFSCANQIILDNLQEVE